MQNSVDAKTPMFTTEGTLTRSRKQGWTAHVRPGGGLYGLSRYRIHESYIHLAHDNGWVD